MTANDRLPRLLALLRNPATPDDERVLAEEGLRSVLLRMIRARIASRGPAWLSDQAEDAVQDLFLKLFERGYLAGDSQGTEIAYVRRMVENHLIDRFRQGRLPSAPDHDRVDPRIVQAGAQADLLTALRKDLLTVSANLARLAADHPRSFDLLREASAGAPRPEAMSEQNYWKTLQRARDRCQEGLVLFDPASAGSYGASSRPFLMLVVSLLQKKPIGVDPVRWLLTQPPFTALFEEEAGP